jgi:hypothetical protein
MHIAWGSLLIVLVVSFASAVVVVSLVAFALVAFSGRAVAAGPDARKPLMSAGAGTAVGGICLAAASLIVLYGLYIIVSH